MGLHIREVQCCRYTPAEEALWGCTCSEEERVLRARSAGHITTPLTQEERAWCVAEAYWYGEGYYQQSDLEALEDRTLCGTVLSAWQMYCDSQGFL